MKQNNKSEIEELKEEVIKHCDIMEYPLNDSQIIEIDKAVFKLTQKVKKQSFNQGILKAKDEIIKMIDKNMPFRCPNCKFQFAILKQKISKEIKCQD